ncbi:hypothetical protein M3Y97_00003400 [Aphelenchoides bicaudatus]|nr:hypothetical protein M3Y97_00003400 [Aphelenchoides bicaudatus]
MKVATVFLLALSVCLLTVDAVHLCATVTGILQCRSDPTKHHKVEVYLWDEDGYYPVLRQMNPDDLMATASSVLKDVLKIPELTFGVYANKPEPYVAIKHFCGNEDGKWFYLKPFSEFQPIEHNAGFIVLDTETVINDQEFIKYVMGN